MNAKEKAYALGAAVIAGLTAIIFVVRPRVGNTVEVPARALLSAGLPVDPSLANERVAVKLTAVQGDAMTGTFVGVVQDANRVVTVPLGSPPVLTFKRSAIVQKLS